MGANQLSVFQSVLVALFFMSVTMAVLAGIYVFIRLFSAGLNAAFKKEKGGSDESLAVKQAAEQHDGLVLDGVDERTAAAIMAIVSHETDIPLSQLRFKSIKPVK